MTFHEGEAFCTARGAHLVTYGNLDEQLDAESYYIKLGALPWPAWGRAVRLGRC